MTDKTELKRLAEAATAVKSDVNITMAVGTDPGEIKAVQDYLQQAMPKTILALIAENERVKARLCVCRDCCGQGEVYSGRSTYQGHNQPPEPDMDVCGTCGGDGVLGPVEDFEALAAERDRLKAENEALRDDIEQKQYDANAWRNGEESVWIEVFNSEGDDPFISAITGQITVEQLTLIQAEILEYREDYFEKGSGLYVFKCRHCQAHHDNVGMTEPAHWETHFESYSPFPWEEDAAAMGEGELS